MVEAPSDFDMDNGNGGMWVAWFQAYGAPEYCYWPADEREWPASIEFGKLMAGEEDFLHFDDAGTAVSDFLDASVLKGLRNNAAEGVSWVQGDAHPVFSWQPKTVTVIDSYAGVTGAGSYRPDETVNVHAGARPGYIFAGWAMEGAAVLEPNANEPEASFRMPETPVTLTAKWSPLVIPETGDTAAPALWLGLIALAGAGLVLLMVRARKMRA